MDRKEINKRLEEIRREINKLAVPKDPNQKKRDKLTDELEKLYRMGQDHFEKSVRETRKLLAKEIAELEAMCKKQFDAVIPVKAKVRVRLDLDSMDLHTFESTCGVGLEFPKAMRNLGLFTLDDDEELSSAGIHNAKQAKGLLPELDRHIKKLEALHARVIKRIKEEAKKHGLQREIDDFIDEVMAD